MTNLSVGTIVTPMQTQFAAGVLRTLAYWRVELAAYASDPAALDAEHANLARAVGWGLAFPATREAAFELLAEAHAVVLGRGALALWQDLLQESSAYAPRTPAGVAVLRLTAEVLEKRGQVVAAVRLYRRAAALARWLGDEALMLTMQVEWGRCWTECGQGARGARWLEHVLGRSQRQGTMWTQIRLGISLAVHYSRIGLVHEALGYLAQALLVAETLGDAGQLARCWLWHGQCHWQLGMLEVAEDSLTRAWEYASQTGHRRVQGSIISNRGNVCHARGEYTNALALFQASREIYLETGDLMQIAWIDQNLGATYWGLKEWTLMRRHLQASVAFWRSIGAQPDVVRTLQELASGCSEGPDGPPDLPLARQILCETRALLATYGDEPDWVSLRARQVELEQQVGGLNGTSA